MPYFRQPVIDAIESVSPERGGTPGDAQAAIEVIIERLKHWVENNIDRMDDEADYAIKLEFTRTLRDLELAERLIEDLHFRDFCYEGKYEFGGVANDQHGYHRPGS